MNYSHRQRDKEERQQKGHGDKTDRDVTESEDDETGKVAALRYPQHNSPSRQYLACPFEKYDPARNQPGTIEQTGVLLPREFEELKSEVRSVSGNVAKWNVIWSKCFPATSPPPLYGSNMVSQLKAQQILQQLLSSSAANPWSSSEIKQSKIEKALGAIYFGLPFTEIEPQINDASTITTDNISTVWSQSESNDDSNDGSATVPEYYDDLGDMDQWTRPLRTAIYDVDHDTVHDILRNSFDKVAVGEYSWLLELKALGISTDDIADELLERAQHGPWIYSKIDVHDVGSYFHDFHLPGCLHTSKEDGAMLAVPLPPSQGKMSIKNDRDNSIRETIAYWCGIGGVSPMPDGSYNLQFGSVVFENANTTAIPSLMTSQSAQAAPYVLQHLHKAIGALQEVGGCCDSFSFLARQEFSVELKRVCPDLASEPGPLVSLTNSETSIKGLNPQLRDSLMAQFLSLAFFLYAQGHCEPFRPFFLDTPLKRILLIGNQIWGPSFTGPCILATPVDLSCFGEMIQRRVFAFQYFDSFERSRVFSDCDKKFDLKVCPEDLLDTWGPGDFIVPKDDTQNIHAISIGGGLITSDSTESESHQSPVLHWSPVSKNNTKITSTFPRHEKMIIGSRVSINQACRMSPQEQVRKSIPWLKDLGTFPSYWEVSERQLGLGLQGGQSAVGILNFAQTWVKRLGQTKKSNILAKRFLSIADLEGPSAVQVSFCTGIARRVRLRELLADVLPAYVEDLATKPRFWENLQGSDILDVLRHEDFRAHYQRLDRELQAELETLAIAVLFLLQDTGVDRKGENFVVGYIPQGVAVQCFEIPIEKQSFWARILADSEEVATFAYVATRCFETDLVKCRGPREEWRNTTSLFSTEVSLCQDRMQGMIAQQQTPWTLKDSEAYLIGRVDAPLLVRVIRPNIQDEPELLVSMSTIIAPFLRRWSRKQGYKRPWLLRESRAIDHQHQMAESVVVTADFQGL
ncbi:WD repeat-containing protein [Fusarium subglutinans]|uniref:WD repeat-containing protein n=1 Tax=Gibberella subglutinans TaxID=42677 RepID=A0A8H5Q082_GIBSU|nr:WD repeat-containing protein [Fusarium subglutinans]KAF5606144.1 WD repeat-containing protein [Fusarium subglutinans]